MITATTITVINSSSGGCLFVTMYLGEIVW